VPIKGPIKKKNLNDPESDMQDSNPMEHEHKIKNEAMMFGNDNSAFNNMMMPFDQFMHSQN